MVWLWRHAHSWVLGLALWTATGAIAGGVITARILNDVLGTPAVAEVIYTPTPIPKPTPTYTFTPTPVPTPTLVPTPRPTISASPQAQAAASVFALNRR